MSSSADHPAHPSPPTRGLGAEVVRVPAPRGAVDSRDGARIRADDGGHLRHARAERLAVKPGLTGLWQISGRSDLRVEDAVRLDLDYVGNWSLLRDVMIIAKTVKTVLTADGAY